MKRFYPVAIVQARVSGGTRLPGIKKVLADIGGRSLIEHQMERMQRSKLLRKVVVAIPDNEANDELALYCKERNWAVFRGPEHDVLRRYAQAAKHYKADPVVRVTADCPYLDHGILDGLIRLYKESGQLVAGGFDYAATNLERTLPHGTDCEIMSAKVLREADEKAVDKFDREHVTEYIRRHQDAPYKLGNLRYPIETADPLHAAILVALRITVDYEEDLALVRAIADAFPPDHFITTADIVGLMAEKPELMKLNEHHALEHSQRLDGRFEPVSEDAVVVERLRKELAAKKAKVILQ